MCYLIWLFSFHSFISLPWIANTCDLNACMQSRASGCQPLARSPLTARPRSNRSNQEAPRFRLLRCRRPQGWQPSATVAQDQPPALGFASDAVAAVENAMAAMPEEQTGRETD